jgi:hypothetical protein
MALIKHFCRMITTTDLNDDQVITFFDIVQSVAAAKLVTAYADQAGEIVSVEVISYTNPDQPDQNVYEILLEENLDAADGDQIATELNQEFDFDFDFEASIEV